jgi:phage terminase large subunit GpA-like protein
LNTCAVPRPIESDQWGLIKDQRIGYIMHHLCNKDMLLTVPTLELRQRSLNPRLRKIFRETAVLAELVSSANRGDLIEYGAGAKIIKAGANSPDSMRSDHLPYVGKDEVDAYPWDVGGEGDPNELIANRQRSFTRAKTYEVSTPTVEGASHIDNAYQASDRRRYHVPCPHCGHLHVLAWRHFQQSGRVRSRIAASHRIEEPGHFAIPPAV